MENFVDFDAIKREVTIQQVLEHYGLLQGLRQHGDALTGPCPLHQGHNPTQFRVSLAKNCFICFGDCHRGGSIVDFVSLKEGIGIRQAGQLLQDWFQVHARSTHGDGRNGKKPHPPVASADGEEPENRPLGFSLGGLDTRHPYLKERGLDDQTLRVFGLGYCRVGWLTGRIAIPIHNARGELVAYAGRWPGEPPADEPKYKLPRGFKKSRELFNLHRAKQADARLPLVVVEGFFGCMKVWQAGQARVVSLMGSLLSEAQEELIARTVGPSGRVLLFFDEDESGRKGRAQARERLEKILDVRVVSFDREGVQPDALPPETLLALLHGQKP
jgi:DNA primase